MALFANPWLLLIAPVTLGVAVLVTLRREHAVRRPRLALALRCVIALCIAIGVAGPRWSLPGRRICRIFVLDASTSASDAFDSALADVRASVAQMKPDDLAGLIVFGAEPAVEIAPTRADEFDLPDEVRSRTNPDATDAAAAIRLARDAFPDGPQRQLVLMWDGNATTGDADDEAALAGADGIEVIVAPMDAGRIVDARIEALRVPERSRSGRKIAVEAVVSATSPMSVRVAITIDGKPCGEPRLLRIGRDGTAAMIVQIAPDDGPHDIVAAIIEPRDDFAANDSIARPLYVGGKTPVLVVSSQPNSWPAALAAGNPSFDVTSRTAFGPADFDRFDCVVLDNVPAQDFGDEDHRSLGRYVDAGGGLIVLGGRRAFGPGGYVGTPIEKLLPVSCDPQRRESKPITVAIVLDKSGSMNEKVAGRPKIDYARLAVLRVLDELKPDDFVSLITFDSSATLVLPPTRVGDAGGLRRIVARIHAGGRTDLNPPLDAAWTALKDRPPGTCHILLLSDGLSDAEVDSDAVAKRLGSAKITLSAVATGDDADVALLERLAKATGGRFYPGTDIRRLHEVFAADVRLRARQLVIDKPAAARVVGEGGPLTGISELPELGGYILTAPKDGASVHAVAGEQRDVLLASWTSGLGRVAAFTSEPGGKWCEAWQRWPDRGKFWNQIIRAVARPADNEAIAVELEHTAGKLRVTATVDGDAAALPAKLVARASAPDGTSLDAELKRTGVRTFEGTFDAPQTGAWSVTVSSPDAPQSRATARLHTTYSDEWRSLGLDAASLRNVASAAGGEVVYDTAKWSGGEASGRETRDFGWLLLLAAVAVFLADLALT